MDNVVEFEARATVERQAREWLIRLDGDTPLSDTELATLREWMGRSPSHRAELTRLSKFWKQANVLTELAVPLIRQTEARGARSRRGWRAMLVTASAVLASVSLGLWWFQRSDGAANGTYGTAIGQQQTISLHDGSSIQLNTDSQVQVDYGNARRKIRLLKGEALFAVTPNPTRPFDVYAANGIVHAVGTAFSVHLEGSRVDVTVTKGIVAVSEIGGAETIANPDAGSTGRSTRRLGQLKAGQTATFGSDTQQIAVRELAELELRSRMAWHEGYLVFSGEPLSEVVEQVNRYSPVTLHIADPKLATIAVGGRFRIGDLDAILDVLRANFGIQSSRIDERDIQLERGRPR
jgi:transmembrane sensor